MYGLKWLEIDYEIVLFGQCPIYPMVLRFCNHETKLSVTRPEEIILDIS